MDLKEIKKKVIHFRDKRDWAQYHNPKDLAISISLEAAELLEIFQWKDPNQIQAIKSDPEVRERVGEELGDIFIYALTLAHEFDLEPDALIIKKMKINEQKYPVEKVKGKSKKYTAYTKKG